MCDSLVYEVISIPACHSPCVSISRIVFDLGRAATAIRWQSVGSPGRLPPSTIWLKRRKAST